MGLKQEIARRLELYFKQRGWTKAEFADILEIYPQHVNKVFEAKLDPLVYVDKLVKKEGADKNWLLAGIKTQDKERKYVSLTDELNNKVPEIHEYPIVGHIPAGFAEVKTIEYPEYEPLDFDKRKFFWLIVDADYGDSMRPAIKPGDKLLCYGDTNKNTVKDGEMVAVLYDETKGAVKILRRSEGKLKNVLSLESINPTYKAITVHSTDIKAMYRVVLILKK